MRFSITSRSKLFTKFLNRIKLLILAEKEKKRKIKSKYLILFLFIYVFLQESCRRKLSFSTWIPDKKRRDFFIESSTKRLQENFIHKRRMEGINCALFLSDKTIKNIPFRPSDGLVTIVTPVFNPSVHELQGTADCILAQTYIKWEWIIVDDYSSSYYSRKVKAFADVDNRIRFIRRSEIGSVNPAPNLGKARNTGLLYSKGLYVFFLDGDDKMDPTTIEKMVQFLCLYEKSHFVTAHMKAFGFSSYEWDGDLNPSWKFRERNMVVATSLHRKSSLNLIGNYSERDNGLEDWDTWLKYANANKWGGTIPETLLYVRKRKSHTDRWKDLSSSGMKQFQESINAKYPNLSGKKNWPLSPIEAWKNIKLPPTIDWHRSNSIFENCCHLLIILDSLEYGISSKVFIDLLSGLKRLNWKFTIISIFRHENSLTEEFQNITYDIFFLDSLGSPMTYLNTVSEIIYSRSIDAVIIGQSFYGHNILPYLRESFPNFAYVNLLDSPISHRDTAENTGYFSFTEPNIDLIFVASSNVKEQMIGNGVDPSKLVVSYLGPNLKVWHASDAARKLSRKALGFSSTDYVILCNTRLEPLYQPLLLLHTSIELLQTKKSINSRDIYFVILGSGSQSSKIKKIIQQQPKEIRNRIIYFNDVSYFSLPDLTRAADISFSTSIINEIPRSYYESMSMGSVVIGFDVEAVNEIICNNETGLLVKMKDSSFQNGHPLRKESVAFRSAVKKFSHEILNILHSNRLRRSLSEKARKKMKEFSSGKMVELFSKNIRNIIDYVNVKRKNKLSNPEKVKSAILNYESLIS